MARAFDSYAELRRARRRRAAGEPRLLRERAATLRTLYDAEWWNEAPRPVRRRPRPGRRARLPGRDLERRLPALLRPHPGRAAARRDAPPHRSRPSPRASRSSPTCRRSSIATARTRPPTPGSWPSRTRPRSAANTPRSRSPSSGRSRPGSWASGPTPRRGRSRPARGSRPRRPGRSSGTCPSSTAVIDVRHDGRRGRRSLVRSGGDVRLAGRLRGRLGRAEVDGVARNAEHGGTRPAVRSPGLGRDVRREERDRGVIAGRAN